MIQRVELHLHTTTSDAVSVITPREAIQAAVRTGLKAIAVTDRNSVQSFYEVEYCRWKYGGELKVIYGAELLYEGNEVTVLAKDREGLKALYRLISGKDITPEERKHLLIGAINFSGFKLTVEEEPEKQRQLAAKYDYIELLHCREHGIGQEWNKDLYALGKKLGIPVVATGNCRCITPEEYACVQAVERCRDADSAIEGSYLQTTEELLQRYAYLGEEAAREVVLTTPERIADSIRQLKLATGDVPAFALPEAFDTVVHLCEVKMEQLYGDKVQKSIRRRILEELALAKPYASDYLLSHQIVKHLHEMGAITGTRGTVGSTLLAYLLEISDVNPLPAHYYCKVCKHVEFAEADSGYDLPGKICPHCGSPMQGDGHDIPYETCMSVEGELPPDIDINVPVSYHTEALNCVVQLMGRERVAYAGTVYSFMDRLAESYVRVYEDLQGEEFSKERIKWMTEKISGIKKGEGRHPGGIVLLPEGIQWEDVTPVKQLRRKDLCSIDKVTHMEYHAMEPMLRKLDLLGYGLLDRLQKLFAVTGTKPEQVDYQDPAVYELFRRADTCGVPEFSHPSAEESLHNWRKSGSVTWYVSAACPTARRCG